MDYLLEVISKILSKLMKYWNETNGWKQMAAWKEWNQSEKLLVCFGKWLTVV